MKSALPLALAVAVLSGCATRYIGDTRIEDTSENREVLRVVEQYRRAVEDKDVGRILELTSDRYFEDPGTPHDPRDDYDKAGLRERLEASFAKVTDQALVVNARKVEVDEDRGTVTVDYVFDYRFRLDLPGPGGKDWRKEMDVNRVDLVREGEDWRFVSGL